MIKATRFGTAAALAGFMLALVPVANAQKAPATAAAPVAKAASACKGLEEAACGKLATECIWRAASTRKNGVAVKAHCRKKPDITKAQAAKDAKKAAAAKAAPAKAEVKADPKKVEKPAEAAKPVVKKAATPPPAATTTKAPAADAGKAAVKKAATPPPAATAPAKAN